MYYNVIKTSGEMLGSFGNEEEAIEYAKNELASTQYAEGSELIITKDVKLLTKGKTPVRVKNIK